MKKYYYSIGEVSRLLDLKPHILRYWESEFPMLRPRKTKGGSRRYTTKDIELLRRIQYMLHMQKFTIEGVRRRLSNTSVLENEEPAGVSSGLKSIREQLTAVRALLAEQLENRSNPRSLPEPEGRQETK